jgi:hypothetical protein
MRGKFTDKGRDKHAQSANCNLWIITGYYMEREELMSGACRAYGRDEKYIHDYSWKT